MLPRSCTEHILNSEVGMSWKNKTTDSDYWDNIFVSEKLGKHTSRRIFATYFISHLMEYPSKNKTQINFKLNGSVLLR